MDLIARAEERDMVGPTSPVAEIAPVLAVTVVAPFATTVTRPEASTVATAESLLARVTAASELVCPSS